MNIRRTIQSINQLHGSNERERLAQHRQFLAFLAHKDARRDMRQEFARDADRDDA